MTYTEQDVERADEAYQRAFDAADRTGPAEGRFQRSHLAGLRAALEAMERELYQSRYGGRDPGEDYDFAAGHFEVTDDVFEVVGVEPEPLEDVLRDTRSWLQHLEVALQDDGQFACTVYGYEVTGTDSPVMDATRYGADPADAIRNAINAAQEER